MDIKEIIENEFTFGELLTINDMFDGDTGYSDYCNNLIYKIKEETNSKEIDDKELIIIIKTLIIERLKYALYSIQQSTNIL